MNPVDPPDHDDTIARLVESCAADERIVAAILGGSRARGEADEFSDLDVSLIVADDAYTAFVAEEEAFIRSVEKPLFLETFGHENLTFVILADGTEFELYLFRVSELDLIRSGPHRVLLDKEGILTGREFPAPEVGLDAQVEELRKILFWFWHDVGHFTSAIGRGQLWWAAGQLEQLRHYCVNLVRAEQHVEVNDGESQWKLDTEISTGPLEPLRSTFVPFDRDAMLRAGRDVIAFFRGRAPSVAAAHGLSYPEELDAAVTGHLDRLATDTRVSRTGSGAGPQRDPQPR